jgi:hypothetical protein
VKVDTRGTEPTDVCWRLDITADSREEAEGLARIYKLLLDEGAIIIGDVKGNARVCLQIDGDRAVAHVLFPGSEN